MRTFVSWLGLGAMLLVLPAHAADDGGATVPPTAVATTEVNAAAAPAADAPVVLPMISWGRPTAEGYRLGLARADKETIYSGKPVILDLYCEAPAGVTTPPTLTRKGRQFRAVGPGDAVADYICDPWQPTGKANQYRCRYIAVTFNRNGNVSVIALQQILGGTLPLPTATGMLVFSVTSGEGMSFEPLSDETQIAIMKETLYSMEFPGLQQRNTQLRRVVGQLTTLSELYSPRERNSLNLLWCPEPVESERVNLDEVPTTMYDMLTEIARQTDRRLVLDTSAALMVRKDMSDAPRMANADTVDPAVVSHLKQINFRRISYSHYKPSDLITNLEAISRQNDPSRKGFTCELAFPDPSVLPQDISVELKEVNLDEFARYLSVILGCRFTVTADKIVFSP